MHVIETLAPIFLLLLLGGALTHWRFLGKEFLADLNRLAFWIVLPAFVFSSIAGAGSPGRETLSLAVVVVVTTLTVFLGTWIGAKVFGFPEGSVGALVQAGFRGNLAFIAIPVLAYSFDAIPPRDADAAMASAVLVLAPMMALYNVLSVIALLGSRGPLKRGIAFAILRSILGNPLIIASMLGLLVSFLPGVVPAFAGRTLEALGGAAVPIALLCIGGSLVSLEWSGRGRGIAIAAMIKVVLCPLVALLFSSWFGLAGADLRIALVMAASPTAAASYIMARQMGGDEALASGAIALSTALAFIPLTLILFFY